MRRFLRFLRALPLLLVSPLLVLVPAIALLLADAAALLRGRRRKPDRPLTGAERASIIIPTWNGKALLERNLPSLLAAAPDAEIIIVDNASADGTADFLAATFPGVRVLRLETNLGFGGGCNAGARAARGDVVVMLNNDMRVEPDFLAPLLHAFTDEKVFAVSCQIYFQDQARKREETGLTEGWWENGGLRVRHRIDLDVDRPFPCFYGGGGSCAFDRAKFLELGGFDPLYEPFYLEDADLGYLAWKRGWKVLYQPASVVHHEHRGTIGRLFTQSYIQTVLHRNFQLFAWKNIHAWSWLVSHFFFSWAGAVLSLVFGPSPERTTLESLWRALLRLPQALKSRWRARRLAAIDDAEAFRRPQGAYFRDRFGELPASLDKLRVLFVSPYPLCPPVHGGGVFMYQTCRELASLCELHLVALLDYAPQRRAHQELARRCASAEFLLRLPGQPKAFGSILPHAIHEFANDELRWLIHRQVYLKDIDVVQLEYLPMAQYAGHYRRLACILFEHDIYFQSIRRGLRFARGFTRRVAASFEYLRALRYELRTLPAMDRVQVCSADNAAFLRSFLPRLAPRVDDGYRAGIDVTNYSFQPDEREPATMLFLGSFRHQPNLDALLWFVKDVLPRVVAARPDARLVVIGSDPPPRHSLPGHSAFIEFRGFVEDISEALRSYAVFVCPILSGSGVRVKLLEAFATGIPVVSTRLGAEGLATEDGLLCALADEPGAFAERILGLFDDPANAAAMAARARAAVEKRHDTRLLTAQMVESYRATLAAKRGESSPHVPG